ncbi:MAG: uncharacterized protein KVP18_003264 [Porospora cf. gigantea A]|uniref:uncharacterized protein n=1 Tax=Porospora cf. gigantea A TaxID=2853593 RepID=UPI00355A1511|nr:MAG: hypothetical protein KVP18_003264 [Porospora cf. gigantea A]
MSFVPVEVKPLFTAKVEDYDWFRWRPDRPSVPATQSYGWTSEPPSPKVPCSEAPEAHSPEVPSPKVPCSEAPEAHSPEVPYSAETSADPAANISERSTELITEDSTELDNSTSETTEVPHVVASVVYVDASKVIVNELTGASPTSSNSTSEKTASFAHSALVIHPHVAVRVAAPIRGRESVCDQAAERPHCEGVCASFWFA